MTEHSVFTLVGLEAQQFGLEANEPATEGGVLQPSDDVMLRVRERIEQSSVVAGYRSHW